MAGHQADLGQILLIWVFHEVWSFLAFEKGRTFVSLPNLSLRISVPIVESQPLVSTSTTLCPPSPVAHSPA